MFSENWFFFCLHTFSYWGFGNEVDNMDIYKTEKWNLCTCGKDERKRLLCVHRRVLLLLTLQWGAAGGDASMVGTMAAPLSGDRKI